MNEMELLKIFSKNLKEMLKESDMKQEELADEIGISQAMISRYITGQSLPGILTLVKIADVLDCLVDDLLY